DLENRMQEIQNSLSSVSPPPPPALSSSKGVSASEGSPPRVLVAVGRSHEPGASGEIYVSGRDGFYDDLIRLAGGQNAYGDETLKFPALSAEGIVQLDPDVIIEMIPDLGPEMDMEGLLARWHDIPGLQATRSGRVHILGGDHVVVPGPRFVTLLEEMAALIHGIGMLENGE
ncbi:MAG: ABC transporter substrate-binding protein, partial [candidate division NC10 bacterium]